MKTIVCLFIQSFDLFHHKKIDTVLHIGLPSKELSRFTKGLKIISMVLVFCWASFM